MGNNTAFTAFEATVIAVYNRGLFDQELLTELMKPYEGSDIDTGGETGTLANAPGNYWRISQHRRSHHRTPAGGPARSPSSSERTGEH
jgi:hypothetical protein